MHARASSILRIPVSVPYSAIILFAVVSLLIVLVQAVDYVKALFAPCADNGMTEKGV